MCGKQINALATPWESMLPVIIFGDIGATRKAHAAMRINERAALQLAYRLGR